MTRWIVAASWLLFAAITYLILGEAVARWIGLPILGNIGFTLVFVLFALFHCIALEGIARTGMFFGVSAVVSYVMEEVGVRSGLIYGAYHYSDLLGPKLGHVPVIIPLAWFMMIYPSWMVAKAMLRGIDGSALPGLTAQALVAAWVITGWDMVMDPGMALAGNWVWDTAELTSACRAGIIWDGCSLHSWCTGQRAGCGAIRRSGLWQARHSQRCR